jgi:putative flippase GtrA
MGSVLDMKGTTVMIAYYPGLRSIFLKSSTKTSVQILRSLLAGGVAFAVDWSVLFFLTEIFHIHYLVSSIIGFIFGLSLNYFISISWVFNKRFINKKRAEFIVFSVIGIIGLLVNSLFVWVFTEYAYSHYLMSKVFATVIVFSWNFTAKKLILFR